MKDKEKLGKSSDLQGKCRNTNDDQVLDKKDSAMFFVTHARACLVTQHPLFGCLAMRLDPAIDNSCNSGWVNGEVLGVNEDYVLGLSLDELMTWIAHEVAHLALCHHTKIVQPDFKKWNIAADYVVNQLLMDCGFVLPSGALIDDAYMGLNVEAVYNELTDDQLGGSYYGEVRTPVDMSLEGKIREETRWEHAAAQSIYVANVMGKPVASFGRMMKSR